MEGQGMKTKGTESREAASRTKKPGHWYFRWHMALRLRAEYRGLTLTQIRVLDALIVHADNEGAARPSLARIARFCPGASNGSICRALRELERRGFVHTDRGDRTRASRYRLWCGGGAAESDTGVRTAAVRTGTDGGRPCNPHVNPPLEVRTPSVSSPPSGKKETETSPQRLRAGPSSLLRSQDEPDSILLSAIKEWKRAGLRHTTPLRAHTPRDLHHALARVREIKSKIANDPRRFGAYLSCVLISIPDLAKEWRARRTPTALRASAARLGSVAQRALDEWIAEGKTARDIRALLDVMADDKRKQRERTP
jgi:hypothetical protein